MEELNQAFTKAQTNIFTKYDFEGKIKGCMDTCTPLKNRYLAKSFANDQLTQQGVAVYAKEFEEEDELLELSLMCVN